MARNNLTWIKGDITGDIYYDIFRLDGKDVQYLRLYLMIKGVFGARRSRGCAFAFTVRWQNWSTGTSEMAAGSKGLALTQK